MPAHPARWLLAEISWDFPTLGQRAERGLLSAKAFSTGDVMLPGCVHLPGEKWGKVGRLGGWRVFPVQKRRDQKWGALMSGISCTVRTSTYRMGSGRRGKEFSIIPESRSPITRGCLIYDFGESPYLYFDKHFGPSYAEALRYVLLSKLIVRMMIFPFCPF